MILILYYSYNDLKSVLDLIFFSLITLREIVTAAYDIIYRFTVAIKYVKMKPLESNGNKLTYCE